jgi:hypothetical protein
MENWHLHEAWYLELHEIRDRPVDRHIRPLTRITHVVSMRATQVLHSDVRPILREKTDQARDAYNPARFATAAPPRSAIVSTACLSTWPRKPREIVSRNFVASQ